MLLPVDCHISIFSIYLCNVLNAGEQELTYITQIFWKLALKLFYSFTSELIILCYFDDVACPVMWFLPITFIYFSLSYDKPNCWCFHAWFRLHTAFSVISTNLQDFSQDVKTRKICAIQTMMLKEIHRTVTLRQLMMMLLRVQPTVSGLLTGSLL